MTYRCEDLLDLCDELGLCLLVQQIRCSGLDLHHAVKNKYRLHTFKGGGVVVVVVRFFNKEAPYSRCIFLVLLRFKLMLLKCKLILLKCQINTNTNKNRFMFPTKCLEGVLKYSYLVSIIFIFLFMFADF